MTMVSFKDALAASAEYFGGDEMAADVFIKKYALRDENHELLEMTPDDMHRRLAREFARIEAKYPNPMFEDEIFELLRDFRYIVPQGSPMSGIGNDYSIQSLSNCFVIKSPHDSYAGILTTDQEQVQIMKRRGGVGFDISTIRPAGLITSNASRTTDGIAVFMQRFSNSCREVAQGGRRGALMLTLDIRHPDVETFIDIKKDLTKITGANISLRVSDEFMNAVESDSDFTLQWPVDAAEPTYARTVKARQIWDKIIDSAWSAAEPGVLFWDTVKRETPADIFSDEGFGSVSTNPCGEIVLSPYDSCRLLVVNALSYVRNAFTEDATFDLKLFNEHAVKAQRLMDDLIDIEIEHIDAIIKKVESDPEPDDIKAIETALWQKIRDACVKGRRTGLGLTGVGDTLAYLNIRYGSKESILMIEELYRSLAVAANKSSVQLAVERGAFPICDVSRMVKHQFISRLLDASDAETRAAFMKYGRRNICLTTTAPAGSVSLMTRTTSGIEPAYMLQYVRRRKLTQNDVGIRVDFEDSMGDKWQEYDVFHPGFKHWRDVSGLTDVKSSPYHMSTSNDVDWVASVDVQAVAQRWIEHSLSKTCNLPASTTRDVVAQVYMRAWKTGCKGFTVYRDGCRAGVLVSAKTNDVATTTKTTRPKELPCEIHHANIKGEAWTILVGMIDEKPYEIFGGLSRFVEIPKKYDRGLIIKNERKTMAATYDLRICNGSDITIKDIVEQFDNPNHSVMTRMISLALRQGAPIQQVVEQLQKGDRDSDMFSFAKVLSRVLKGYIVDGAETDIVKKCDSCGGTKFHYSEGCVSCSSCGWSRC